jgi:hypothetical protein
MWGKNTKKEMNHMKSEVKAAWGSSPNISTMVALTKKKHIKYFILEIEGAQERREMLLGFYSTC